MSLKAVHLAVITCATLFSFGFGAWCFHAHANDYGVPGALPFGIACCLGGAALAVYGVRFLRKLKGVSCL